MAISTTNLAKVAYVIFGERDVELVGDLFYRTLEGKAFENLQVKVQVPKSVNFKIYTLLLLMSSISFSIS